MSIKKKLGLKILALILLSSAITKLLINEKIDDRFSGLNVQFNDLLVLNLPSPRPSGLVASVGVGKDRYPEYFETRFYPALEKIIEDVMKSDPIIALSTFMPYTINAPTDDLKRFVQFAKKFPNLYFYTYYEPADNEDLSRHPIMKDLKTVFIPLTTDKAIPPYDSRMRRLIIDYSWNNYSYGQPLFGFLKKAGIERKSEDFNSFELLESRQAYLRYRGADTYSQLTTDDLRNNLNVRDKILVFGPAEANFEDPKYRTTSIYRGRFLSSRERVAMILDTLIEKDPISRTSKNARLAITFALVFLYLHGLLFLKPVKASFWGGAILLLFMALSTSAYLFLDQFLFLTEAAAGIGAIHFFAAPALLIRYLRAQDKKAAEQQRQIELQNLRSTLVVKSARADMGLKIATQVAHDIRGPLGAINIAAQMRNKDESDEVTKLLTTSVERLQRISDDLLKKFRTGEFFDQTSFEISLLPFLNELCEGYRVSWPRLNISVTGDANAAVLVTDKTALERAFSNLINNSIEACAKQANANINILISAEPENYVIHFADDGPGIPAEAAGKLFQRGATFGKTKGSGLGLAQVRETVEGLNGNILLIPAPKGAHFKITLPKPQSRRAALKLRKDVIIVEDNASIRLHWQTRLTAAGCNVTAASSPEEFDAIRLTSHVTVITDLIFETSDRTGFNVLEQCKRAQCQTILCSSLGGNAEIQKMALPLADVVLTKNQFDLMALSIDT